MIGYRHDYSWPERALSIGATLTLAVLAVTSLVVRYVTNPLSCFLPSQFSDSDADYAYQLCFHSQAIFSPFEAKEENPPTRFTYHQWLPFFLGILAPLCLLPYFLSRLLTPFLWLDPHQLVATLTPTLHHSPAHRHALFRRCALLLQTGLKGGNSGLARAALGRKVLGCVVCFLQMLFMVLVFPVHQSLQAEETEEGFMASSNSSVPLPVSSFICSFTLRLLSRVHKYSVVCFMPLAHVYTKGLVFLIFFFLVLLVLNTLDLVLCASRLLMPGVRDATLTRFLSLPSQSESQTESSDPAHSLKASQSEEGAGGDPAPVTTADQSESQSAGDDDAQLSGFLEGMGMDGRFVVAVVGERCGALAAADLTLQLYQVYKKSPFPRPTPPPPPPPADSSGSPKAAECEEETGAIPMVTIIDQDGDKAAQQDEKAES